MAKAERYSTPPSAAKLVASTGRLKTSLDALEQRVGSQPMPIAVAVAALELTDEQRLAVCRELSQLWYQSSGKTAHLDQVMANYEREARARLAAGKVQP